MFSFSYMIFYGTKIRHVTVLLLVRSCDFLLSQSMSAQRLIFRGPDGINSQNTKIDSKYVYYQSLADIGITDTASVTWDNIVSALPERAGIQMAGWKPSVPGLTLPAAGPAIVITVDKYLSGYVTLQVWDIATNTVYCTTHNGVNYSTWKTL